MRSIVESLARAANSDATVLFRGESGTGKGIFAHALHRQSPRRDRPFVTVNCPTLSEELLASELFGHVKGAFTGAVRDQVGRVESADGGTLFLDEIAEVTPNLQAKLLRFLQEKQFERLGDNHTRHADVRVIAATNRILEDDVAHGRFREDLYTGSTSWRSPSPLCASAAKTSRASPIDSSPSSAQSPRGRCCRSRLRPSRR